MKTLLVRPVLVDDNLVTPIFFLNEKTDILVLAENHFSSDKNYIKKQLVLIGLDPNEKIEEVDNAVFGDWLIEIYRISTPNDTVTFTNPLDNKLQTLEDIDRFKKSSLLKINYCPILSIS